MHAGKINEFVGSTAIAFAVPQNVFNVYDLRCTTLNAEWLLRSRSDLINRLNRFRYVLHKKDGRLWHRFMPCVRLMFSIFRAHGFIKRESGSHICWNVDVLVSQLAEDLLSGFFNYKLCYRLIVHHEQRNYLITPSRYIRLIKRFAGDMFCGVISLIEIHSNVLRTKQLLWALMVKYRIHFTCGRW